MDVLAPASADAKHQIVTQPRGASDAASWASGTPARYGLAVLAVLAAVALRRVLTGVLDNSHVPFLFQFVAVLAAAAFGGLGPGLLATALATLAGYFLFVASPGGEHLSAQLIVFALEGCLISALGGWLHWARHRAESGDIARANLEKQMLEIGDKERRRFGHDLHDGLGQQLTGIALMSESLSHRLQAQGSPLVEQAEQITSLVSETIGWTRELARGLSPLTLETDGLLAALEELATRAKKLFGVTCTFDCEHDELPIADESAVHVYRIVQEAVSNSVKHGKAKRVVMRGIVTAGDGTGSAGGSGSAGGRQVIMTVTDDGSGLSAKTVAEPGIGLRIMQYRANLIGAKLSVVRATAQGGTIVTCTIPATDAGRLATSRLAAAANPASASARNGN
jgi:signal transduction histidine kinase